MDLSFKKKLSSQRKENARFFNILNRLNHKTLDESIHSIHEEVFKNTNCLKCANCCKTTGPLYTDKDINRISKKLRIKPSDFTTRYLKIDNDKDYVLNQFLALFCQMTTLALYMSLGQKHVESFRIQIGKDNISY